LLKNLSLSFLKYIK